MSDRKVIRLQARQIGVHVFKLHEEEAMKAALSAPLSQYRYWGRTKGRLWKLQAKGAQILDQHRQLVRQKCIYNL